MAGDRAEPQTPLPPLTIFQDIEAVVRTIRWMSYKGDRGVINQPSVIQGLMNGTPAAANGLVSQVATRKPWAAAMAAM